MILGQNINSFQDRKLMDGRLMGWRTLLNQDSLFFINQHQPIKILGLINLNVASSKPVNDRTHFINLMSVLLPPYLFHFS
jgi:hypothetical protein